MSAEAQKAYMYRIMGARIQRERMKSAQLSRRLQGEEDEEGEDDEEGYDSEQYPDSEPPLSFPVPAIDGLDGSKPAKPKEEKLDPKLVGMLSVSRISMLERKIAEAASSGRRPSRRILCRLLRMLRPRSGLLLPDIQR
mgnify:CR=1 FL=1